MDNEATDQSATQSETTMMINTEANAASYKGGVHERFIINPVFKSNQIRLALPVPLLEETYQRTRVVQDRGYAVDAGIVRIMKSTKKLQYTELMTKVLESLQMFKPEPTFVKQRIERLIRDEYLARDSEDKSILVYLP